MKRYIMEMENDFERLVNIHSASASLKEKTLYHLMNVRNDYINSCGGRPEYSTVEDMMGIMDRFFEAARDERMDY